MSEIYCDPITGSYHYKDYRWDIASSHKSTGAVDDYYQKIFAVRKLPVSPLQNGYTSSKRRFFILDKNAQILPSEQKLFGLTKKGYHEKAWPERIGIKDENNVFVPHYFRSFSMEHGIKPSAEQIVANVFCGRLFPVKMPYYAGMFNNHFGTIGIDLNHIKGVKSLRLDKYLQSKGIELDSVVSLLKAYRNGVFDADLTHSAIAQLMLSMFSIPNAIGELDPNTRNAILLGPNKKNAKFDSIVRIDFEKAIFNDVNYVQNKNSSIYTYPFGMFHREESKNEFEQNLTKALMDKIITPQDADLILALHEVTQRAISHDKIEQAIIQATSVQSNNDDLDNSTPLSDYFSFKAINDFAEEVSQYSKNYTNDIKSIFDTAANKTKVSVRPNISELPSLEK